jgi:hypothetical protein
LEDEEDKRDRQRRAAPPKTAEDHHHDDAIFGNAGVEVDQTLSNNDPKDVSEDVVLEEKKEK